MSTDFLTARITSNQLYSQNRISQHNGIPKEVQYPRSNEYPRKWNIQGKRTVRDQESTLLAVLNFLYSFSINLCNPKTTSPPPNPSTSLHSCHSPPSRIQTFFP